MNSPNLFTMGRGDIMQPQPWLHPFPTLGTEAVYSSVYSSVLVINSGFRRDLVLKPIQLNAKKYFKNSATYKSILRMMLWCALFIEVFSPSKKGL